MSDFSDFMRPVHTLFNSSQPRRCRSLWCGLVGVLASSSTLSCSPSDADAPDQTKSDSGGGETAEDGGDSATPVLDAALSVDASVSSDAALPDAAALSDDTATQHTELSDAGDSDAAMQPVPPLVVPGNSLSNPSFEDPITGWRGMGNASVASTDERAHTGVRSLVASGRTEIWTGPALEIRELVVPGASYHLRAWVSTADGHQAIGASMMAVCATGDAGEADAGEQESYSPVTLAIVDGEWTELSAPLVVPDCELVAFTIYFEGPQPEVDFYVDDISLVAVE